MKEFIEDCSFILQVLKMSSPLFYLPFVHADLFLLMTYKLIVFQSIKMNLPFIISEWAPSVGRLFESTF